MYWIGDIIGGLVLVVILIMLLGMMMMIFGLPFLAFAEAWGDFFGRRRQDEPRQAEQSHPTIIVLGQPQGQPQPAPVHNHYYLVSGDQAQPVTPPTPYALPQPQITVIDGASELRRLRQALPAPHQKQLPRGE